MKSFDINDFNILLEEKEKKYIKENYLEKEKIISLAICLASLGVIALSDGFIENLSLVSTGASLLNAKKESEKIKEMTYKYLRDVSEEYIEGTLEYQKCQELYTKFLEETAEIFVKLSADKDPLELGILYRELLYGGYFSKDNHFEYHDYDLDIGFDYELRGARICSGTGVCRHISKNAIDLYRLLGHTVTYNQVKTLNEKSKYLKHKKLLGLKPPKSNHIVAGIVSEEGKYILDVTNDKIANMDYNEKLATTLKGEYTYYFAPQTIYTRNVELETKSNKEFLNAPKRIITIKEYQDTKEKVLEKIKSHFIELSNYHGRVEYLVDEIANYEKMISRYQDEEPKITKLEEFKITLEEYLEILKTASEEIMCISENKNDKVRKR